MNKQIARQEREGPLGTRRRLLATSVKLSESMAPDLTRIAKECIAKLGVDLPTELYAYNSPQFNAACVKPEEGKLFIMFSSSLLDAFDEAELRFVMGHELGHFIFGHHDLPIGYLLRGNPPVGPQLALGLSSWSRYAEFSADRAGAICVNDFEAVSRALFKLASGVTSSVVRFNLDDFLQQVDEMQIEDNDSRGQSAPQDWFMTHPFSPLRVKA
ncbi:MAG: M48 family metallopeptidase, partial [Pseudomonadales bacterium]|nr:M48 family metallopeptidase [Pseudomonadales bacterium]